MDKWVSGESSFKRVVPAENENGAPVEEARQVYESSSIEELKNRLSEQLKRKETKKRGFRNSLLVMAVLTSVFAVSTVLLLTRVGVLQGRNQGLSLEIEALNSQIQTLESENKSIQSRITMAERERDDLKGRLSDTVRLKESLEEELRKNQTLVGNTNEEKTYLEEILISKTKEIEALRKNSPAAAAATTTSVSGELRTLSQELKEKDAEVARLSEQNRILSNRIEKLYKITNDKIAQINVAKIALEETISEARNNIDREWSTVDLGSIQATPTSIATAAAQPTGDKTTGRKEGRVLAINEEHGFVVVDLGKANGIDSGARLVVKQNGETIAALAPLEIRDVMTACNIKELKSGRKIAVSDSVSIQK